MNALPKPIQDAIAGWLSSGEIEVFIGYEAGTVPLRATPAFVRRPEDVEHLIWDATCENNLVAFLSKYRGKKVGVMAKGCDSRAIVGLMQEGQWRREALRIVSVSCPGVVDPKKVAEKLGLWVEDLQDARLEGNEVAIGDARLSLGEVAYDVCLACVQHNPAIADIAMGEAIADPDPAKAFSAVREMEALSSEERWARFAGEMLRCNLCYACRNACPLCYCNICFADRTMPRWLNQTTRPEDVQFFQVIRTFHLAGRCVGCGACTRACPQGVNLRLFLDKLRAEVLELYGYEAGSDPTARAPLTTYRETDYNDFIMG
jgi:ferredoxin